MRLNDSTALVCCNPPLLKHKYCNCCERFTTRDGKVFTTLTDTTSLVCGNTSCIGVVIRNKAKASGEAAPQSIPVSKPQWDGIAGQIIYHLDLGVPGASLQAGPAQF